MGKEERRDAHLLRQMISAEEGAGWVGAFVFAGFFASPEIVAGEISGGGEAGVADGRVPLAPCLSSPGTAFFFLVIFKSAGLQAHQRKRPDYVEPRWMVAVQRRVRVDVKAQSITAVPGPTTSCRDAA